MLVRYTQEVSDANERSLMLSASVKVARDLNIELSAVFAVVYDPKRRAQFESISGGSYEKAYVSELLDLGWDELEGRDVTGWIITGDNAVYTEFLPGEIKFVRESRVAYYVYEDDRVYSMVHNTVREAVQVAKRSLNAVLELPAEFKDVEDDQGGGFGM